MDRAFAYVAAALVAAGLIAAAAVLWLGGRFDADGDAFAACRRGGWVGGAADIGGPFTLTNGAGARVTEAEVVTKPTLLYFGYTFCPDFCPTDLSRNAAAADILAEQGMDAGLVFVTFDPERDTPEIASEYAAYIHPEMIGLSGSPEDVAAAAGAYRVFHRKVEGDPDLYLMEHSTYTYLVAPGRPFLEFYPSSAAPEEVAESVACYASRL